MTPLSCKPKQNGVTLVELIVSVALGLILSLILIQVYISTKSASRDIGAKAAAAQNSGYAMELLGRDIQQAGAAPIVQPQAWAAASTSTPYTFSSFNTLLTTDPNYVVSSTNYTMQTDNRVPVRACATNYDQITTFALNAQCPNPPSSSTDPLPQALLVNYFAPDGDAEPNTGFGVTCLRDDGVLSNSNRLISNIYFLRNITMNVDGITYATRALACKTPKSTAQNLVRGVDQMTFRFGVDSGTTPATITEKNPDSGSGSTLDYKKTRYVRVCILVRTPIPAGSSGDNNVESASQQEFTDCYGNSQSAPKIKTSAYFSGPFFWKRYENLFEVKNWSNWKQ